MKRWIRTDRRTPPPMTVVLAFWADLAGPNVVNSQSAALVDSSGEWRDPEMTMVLGPPSHWRLPPADPWPWCVTLPIARMRRSMAIAGSQLLWRIWPSAARARAARARAKAGDA